MHTATPLRGRSQRRFSVIGKARAWRAYFDWHPVLGGFVLMAASTVAVTAAAVFLRASVPTVGGWAICTPLNGAVLAILLMSRRKLWPFILLGYMLALSRGVALAGATHGIGAVEMLGNLAELTIAAFALPPYRSFKQWLQEGRLLRAFGGYALVLGPVAVALGVARNVPGTIGAVADLHAGFWDRVRIVGLAESLGVALGSSLVLVLCNRRTYRLFRWRALGGTVGLLGLLGLATWVAFSQTTYPAIFLPYAILVVVALRLGVPGAVLGTAVTGTMVCILTGLGHTGGASLLPQSYLAMAVLTALPLAVTIFNRNELDQRATHFQVEIDKLKSLDSLTGVANRKRFDLVLNREWQRATRDPKPIALLMIDTDFFDLYNEQYGSHAGDACLRLIAAKMADHPHRQYDLISRLEGGRFSMLLPGASGDSVRHIGEELRAEIAALDRPHERSQFGRVTVSVGWVSMVPETELKPEHLVAAAEAALASARKKGRNRVEGVANNVVEMTAAR